MASPFDYSGVGTAMPESYGTGAPIMDPMAKALLAAIRTTAVPGQALQSTTPVTTGEMVGPAFDLAGLTTLGAGAMPATANELRMGIKAYHGSPHDFEKFDISKIGTGEGAQAYGHGLYFAENPSVAKSYKQVGTKSAPIHYEGDSIMAYPRDQFEALPEKTRQALSFARMNSNIEESISNAKAYGRDDLADEIARLRDTGKLTDQHPGRMYEVDINADPEHFLDWDRPLSEQPHVLTAAKTMGPNVIDRITREGETYFPAGRQFSDIVANEALPLGQATEANISAAMRNAGIPGIKYLDQGSRFQPQQVEHLQNQIAGLEDLLKQRPNDQSVMNALEGRKQELKEIQPTRNYVVFDDKLIDILRKYGIAGLPAAGAVAGAMQPQPSPADMVNAIRGQ